MLCMLIIAIKLLSHWNMGRLSWSSSTGFHVTTTPSPMEPLSPCNNTPGQNQASASAMHNILHNGDWGDNMSVTLSPFGQEHGPPSPRRLHRLWEGYARILQGYSPISLCWKEVVLCPSTAHKIMFLGTYLRFCKISHVSIENLVQYQMIQPTWPLLCPFVIPYRQTL